MDNKLAAQLFMTQNKLEACYEVDGTFFKHKDNAEARAKTSGKQVIPHTVSAGAKPAKADKTPD